MKFLQRDKGRIVLVVIIIMVIGSINVLSASFALANSVGSSGMYFLSKYLIFAALGMFAWWLLSKINFSLWALIEVQIASVLVLVALLLVVHFLGITENGARRWVGVGGFVFQPSEVVKVAVVTLMTGYLAPLLRQRQKASLFSWQFISIIVMGGLVYKQPDLGTAAIIVALSLGMLLICGLPRWQYMLLLSTTIPGVYFLTHAASYRAARIKAWLDPWAYQMDDSYQTVQSFLAIGSGGFSGTGFGQGVSKFFYLPEAHTDFAFAVFCQETGFIGAVLLISCFLYLCILLFKMAKEAQDAHAFLVLVGVNFLITGQVLGNIAMVTGLLPVIGVPLPFISYGGTSMLSLLCSMGLLFSALDSRTPIRLSSSRTVQGASEKDSLRLRLQNQRANGLTNKKRTTKQSTMRRRPL